MLKIIDARRLLRGLGLEEIEVEEQAGKVRLVRGGEKAELTPRQFVKLVFGPERICEFGRDVFPIVFYDWPLDRI